MRRKMSSLVYSLSRLRKPRSRLANFFEHGTAALAHGRLVRVLTDVRREIPTALALQPGSFADLHHNRGVAISCSLSYFDGGNDKEVAQIVLKALQYGEYRINRGQRNLRLQVASDQFLDSRLFQRFQHRFAHGPHRLPVVRLLRI